MLWATSDAALVFYGSSMVLAALRGYAGCEVLAVSNSLLDRGDQIGCMVFAPIHVVERRIAGPREDLAAVPTPTPDRSGTDELGDPARSNREQPRRGGDRGDDPKPPEGSSRPRQPGTYSAAGVPAGSRTLLACGAVAGPLFILVAFGQEFTRAGFDLDLSLSLLSSGTWGRSGSPTSWSPGSCSWHRPSGRVPRCGRAVVVGEAHASSASSG